MNERLDEWTPWCWHVWHVLHSWITHILFFFIKSWPFGSESHLSFDVSSLLGCHPQNHEILLNKGMRYWNSRLNAPDLKTFITIIIIHTTTPMIGRKHSRKEKIGKLNLTPNMLVEWVSSPVEIQCIFFFSCFLKFHPLCDQIGCSNVVFSWCYV